MIEQVIRNNEETLEEQLRNQLSKKDVEISALRKQCDTFRNIAVQVAQKTDSSGNDTVRLLQEELKEKEKQIADLNKKLKEMEGYENQLIHLQETNEELERRIQAITHGRSWRSAVSANVLRSHRLAAKILCNIVKGLSVPDTIKYLYDKENLDIAPVTAYRATSVKEDSDRERILTIFTEFPEVFESYHITKQDIINWFESARIKKMKLVDEQFIRERYGEGIISRISPDRYISTPYYSLKEVEDISFGEQKQGFAGWNEH